MPQARDEAGNIWETDAQGNAVRLVQPAAGEGQVFTLPESPKQIADRVRQQAADARQAQRDASTDYDRATDNQRADSAESRQQAKDDREARQWAAQYNPDGSPKQVLNQQQRGVATMKVQGLGAIASQLDRVETALEAAEKDGFVGPVYGNIPFTGKLDAESSVLDKSIAQLAPLIRQLTRVPGEGAMSDYESRLAAMALPSRSDNPAALRESLAGIRALIDQSQIGYSEMLGQPAPRATSERNDDAAVATSFIDPSPDDMPPVGQGGNDPATPWDRRSDPQETIAAGDMRTERDDRLSAQVDAMVNAGASEATINAVLKQQGFATLPLGSLASARAWMKANPGKQYYGANASREVPLNLGQQIAGSPLGAFTAQMTNAATAGTVGALAGEKGKGALDAMSAMHPNASLGGNILGGITGAGAAELGLGARLAGTAMARYAPRIADGLYGGAYGFNEAEEGEGLQGAATGALLGTVGGAVGERVVRGAGQVARGVANPAIRRLREAGVPLTFGQAVGQSGPIGAGIKKIEDALTSIPGVGNMVERRRMEGLEGFNRAAFDVGSELTGNQVQDYGATGLGQLRQLVGDAYDNALGPVRIDANDADFITDVASARGAAGAIPEVNGARSAAMEGLRSRIDGAVETTSRYGGKLDEFHREGPDRFLSYVGPDGKRAEIHLRVDDAGAAEISIDPFSQEQNRFGAGQLRDAMQQLRSLYPEVTEVWGERLTGAGPGRTQIADLGSVEPAESSISGRAFQEAYRGLARTGRERANLDYGHEVGQVMRQGQDALVGALERQNPGAYDGFVAANSTNRRANVLADAVGRARNADGDIFTPAQLEAADFASANKLTGKMSAALGNRPFAQLAEAGQQVLPSRLPDSGTATRAMTGLALSGAAGGAGGGVIGGADGAGTGAGVGLGATLALMLGGSRPAQRALTSMVLDRPDLIRAAGEEVTRRAQIGGWTGAGILTPLTVGSQ